MRLIHRWLRKQDFNPSYLGIFVNPFYIFRRALWKGIQSQASRISGKILDVGSGRKPYQQLFEYSSYTGIDVDQTGHTHENDQVDIYFDGQHIPFPKDSFDSIISTEVIEHAFEPVFLIREMNRVLKPGGHLLLTTPFMWDEHEKPYDYGRYSSFGLRYLLEKNGFTIAFQQKLVDDVSVFCQLFISYLYKILISKNQIWNMFVFVFIMSPISLFGLILKHLLPSHSDFYLGNLIIAKKSSSSK